MKHDDHKRTTVLGTTKVQTLSLETAVVCREIEARQSNGPQTERSRQFKG